MPIFILFLTVFQAIILLAHWFVFKTTLDFFGLTNNSAAIWILGAILALGSISFLGSSILGFKYKGRIIKTTYVLASYWMVLFYFLLIASALSWIVFGFLPWPGSALQLIAVLYAAALLAALYSIFNTRKLRTTRINIKLPNLPEDWNGKKFAWASDVHLGLIHGEKLVKKIAEIIKKEHPEFLVIGGDLYDGGDTEQEAAKKIIRDLQLPQGKFFITGNHEQFRDPQYFFKHIKEFGLQILLNEQIDLHGLQLIGADYISTRDTENYSKILSKLRTDQNIPALLFKHEPTHIPLAELNKISLQVSGHTHNGQLWPFGLLAKIIYKGFNYGLKKSGQMQVYVSSGAGTWGPPGRFFSKSEIVIFTLQK